MLKWKEIIKESMTDDIIDAIVTFSTFIILIILITIGGIIC